MRVLHVLVLLSVTCGATQAINYAKLYRETVIHYKAPDVEKGKTLMMPAAASTLISDKEHYRTFKKNAKLVIEHNMEANKEWKAELNEFSLETDEEFSQHLGLNISSDLQDELSTIHRRSADRTQVMELELRDLEVDYTPYLPAVKNQGGCGSCWTFGAIAALEYQVNKDRAVAGEMVALSEEQCVDCTSSAGCGGGWPTTCYSWGHWHYSHWASAYNYKYEGSNGLECRYNNHKNGMSGFTFYAPSGAYIGRSDDDVLVAVADSSIGVLSCAVQVADGFGSFSSGVFSSENCNNGVNHAVNIVGYGRLDGVPYWRVRNSWGSWWGDGGYINMKRGVDGNNLNMCHLTQYAHYPYIEGADDGAGSGTASEATEWDCGDGKQQEYRGTLNTTVSDRTCQEWSSQSPHSHSRTPENNPSSGLDANYCRNPDSEPKAWCYTTDSGKRWEYCNAPNCSLVKWCDASEQSYPDALAGTECYDDLDSAKITCYSNENCTGVTVTDDDCWSLRSGSPVDSVGATSYSKGVCKEFIPETGDSWCAMENVTLSSHLTYGNTLEEAMQICHYFDSCAGISSYSTWYRIYGSKDISTSTQTSWFKGDCPDFTQCADGKQTAYRGSISETVSGRVCQAWDTQSPHRHDRTPANNPNSGLDHNYCRNPDGESAAWCYTTDSSKRWELCSIPNC